MRPMNEVLSRAFLSFEMFFHKATNLDIFEALVFNYKIRLDSLQKYSRDFTNVLIQFENELQLIIKECLDNCDNDQLRLYSAQNVLLNRYQQKLNLEGDKIITIKINEQPMQISTSGILNNNSNNNNDNDNIQNASAIDLPIKVTDKHNCIKIQLNNNNDDDNNGSIDVSEQQKSISNKNVILNSSSGINYVIDNVQNVNGNTLSSGINVDSLQSVSKCAIGLSKAQDVPKTNSSVKDHRHGVNESGYATTALLKCNKCRRKFRTILKCNKHFCNNPLVNITTTEDIVTSEHNITNSVINSGDTFNDICGDKISDDTYEILNDSLSETVNHSQLNDTDNSEPVILSSSSIPQKQITSNQHCSSSDADHSYGRKNVNVEVFEHGIVKELICETSEYKCNVCDKSFSHSRHLRRHGRIHTGVKRHKCKFCEKLFLTGSDLKAHERIHLGVKPFECLVCKKSFTQSTNLRTHERIHTGVKPYKCNICDETFTYSSDLKKHKRRMHTDCNNSKTLRFKCIICEKAFIVSTCLKAHHDLFHPGIKPYKCNVCKESFPYFDSLRAHKRIHTSVKPYKCNSCDKSFSLQRYLNKHKINTHKPLKLEKNN